MGNEIILYRCVAPSHILPLCITQLILPFADGVASLSHIILSDIHGNRDIPSCNVMDQMIFEPRTGQGNSRNYCNKVFPFSVMN